MMPIRRGDGTGLSVPGFSEVRKGDGTVLWSSGADIPDSGDLHAHYDFSEEDGATPVSDQTGNGHDLSGSYSGVSRTINGVQAGDFDGTDDNLTVSFSSQSQPNHIFIVLDPDAAENSPFGADSINNQLIFVTGVSQSWALFAGSTVEDGAAATSPTIISALFNGSSSAIRVNGTESTSGVGAGALDGVSLGARGDGSDLFDGLIGEVLVYPQDKSSKASEIESYLADKWGITL